MHGGAVARRRELRLADGTRLTRGLPAPAGTVGAGSLPCLKSNNCISSNTPAAQKRTQHHLRSAFALGENATAFIERCGLENVGFLTLTFAIHLVDCKEGQRRLHSLATNVLRHRYRGWVCVLERMKSGRLHYHLLVNVGRDIRAGADFAAFERLDYRSANQALRSEWVFWRRTAPRYGFGRTELLPIRSNAQGVGRYVGKYIGKHVEQRSAADKGARMVRYGGNFPRAATCRFQFNSESGWLWRQKVAAFARRNQVSEFGELQHRFGPRWCFFLREVILGQPIGEGVKVNEATVWGMRCLGSS